MSKFTTMWRIKHGEPLTYNERIINSACDIIDRQEKAINGIISYPHHCYDCGCTYSSPKRLARCWSCNSNNVVNCFKERYVK